MTYFIQKLSRDLDKKVAGLTPDAMTLLESYQWPGNIRELENVVERAMVLGSGEILGADALPPALLAGPDTQDIRIELPSSGLDLDDTLDRIERRYIQLALERTRGVQTRAAELLGISFRQFRYKLQKHSGRGTLQRVDLTGE